MKRTYQPSVVRRKRTHGFRARMKTHRRPQGSTRPPRQGPRAARRLNAASGASPARGPCHRLEPTPPASRRGGFCASVPASGRRLNGAHLQLLAVPPAGATGRVGYVIGKKLLAQRGRPQPSATDAARSRARSAARRVNAFDIVLRLRNACRAGDALLALCPRSARSSLAP